MLERILKLMKDGGITALKLTSDLGLSNSAVTEWKKGKAKPSTDAIMKIADYFGVSTDYILLGVSEPVTPTLDEQLSDIDFALYGEVRDLTDEQKQAIINVAKMFKQ